MIELYGLVPEIRVFFSALLTISIILQTLRLFLLVSHKQYRIPRTVLIHEIFMLLHLIVTKMLLTILLIQRNIIAGYFHGFRYMDIGLVILGLWVYLKHKKPEPFISAIILIPTLPFFSFTYFKYYFLLINLYLIFRSGVMLEIEWRRIKASITRLSIKEAVDLFPEGILYATEKGRTLISNPAMNRLLSALEINNLMDASSLWEKLTKTQNSYNISVQALEDKLLMRIRNGGSWLFSNETIIVNKKKYIQLLALDITDEDVLTMEMEKSNKALKALGNELSSSMKNIDQLEKEREILRMRTRVHDILGQRLSILSRILESEMDSENMVKSIKPLLTDLTKAITETIDLSPQNLLSSVIYSFGLIGTIIHMKGNLPKSQEVARLFAEIIRECATNAVRHADARNVYVELLENDEDYSLSIRNDGTPPSVPILEGGGITGMRRQVFELSGEFNIMFWPQLCIYIRVPNSRKGEIYYD